MEQVWQPSFITTEEMENPRFFCDFTAQDGIRNATLSITGLGLYRAYINGARVGGDYLTPGFNDYDAYLRYETYDVTALLKAENRIEVFLGNGWYKGRFGLNAIENTFGDRYLLSAQLTVRYADGTEQTVETGEGWLATRSCILENSIYDGEVRDDTRDMGEPVSCRIAAQSYRVVPAPSPAVRCMEERKPVLYVSPKGERILDFGQNMAGVVRFINRLPKGGRLRLQFGEVLQGGCFYRDNLRSARAEYVYISDGAEKAVEPWFTYYGFRYALVEGLDALDPADFTALVLYSALETVLTAETDSPKLNRLLQNAYWSQRGNFVDLPTDCPQRDERLGWTGDAQAFVNTACYQMDCRDFYRKFLWDLRADQTRYCGGDVPMFCPCLKVGRGGGAVWADAATIIPWTVYRHYGDRARLEEAYPLMHDYVETLIASDAAHGNTHIVDYGFSFGDWLALDGATPDSVKGGTEDSFIQTVYYRYSVLLTAKAAKELGETPDAARYDALAVEILRALQAEYFSRTGRLCVDTQTGYVLALHFGLSPDREKMLAGFRARLEKDQLKLRTGFTGTPLLLPTLFDCGMDDAAYRMLYSEAFPGWLYAVNLGATTIWERWNSLLPDGAVSPTGMNSLNHYAYGSVCEAVYSRIAGLKNAAPGWNKAEIAPHPNYRMKHIDLSFRSPAGQWRVAWQIEADGMFALDVTVPEGASAVVRLPAHPEDAAHEATGGKHTYRYRPTVDYLHPFTADSFAADILQNAAAAAALQERLPGLYADMTSDPDGNAAQSPRSIAMRFTDASADVAVADALLRTITV